MPFAAQTLRQVRVGLGTLLVSLLILVPLIARAEGEDPAAIEKITNLNKKALDAYDALEFEDARKLLKQALDLCTAAGLDKHPIKARTHIHMGVVLIAAKQQDLGIKQFRKALEIQPDIQVTKALANPEILQAFEEAGAGAPPPAGGNEPTEPGPGGAGGTPSTPQGRPDEITHMSISRGKKGKPIAITATVSPELTGYTKLVIGYRPQGGGDFVGVDMQRSGNKFVGEIPAEATQGNSVAYYIEAEAEDETPVATSGSEERPYTVSLSEKTRVGDEDEGGGDDDGDQDGPRFFVALLGGIGIGYATGNGEVNADNKVNPGFAPSSAVQFAPEVGYFLNSNLRLSVQLRVQLVRGATAQNLMALGRPSTDLTCGVDQLCSPATSAFAAFARASWFFGSGTFRPYFSLALGGGEIRHIVKFTSLATATNPGTCGSTGREACVDTVVAGPIFAGPGGGVLISLSRNFGLIAEVGSLLGFPKFTFHLDFNGGVAGRF
jgi:hypothetical protein